MRKQQGRVPFSTDGEQAPYFFHQGTSSRAYEYLGVHRKDGAFVFRVWAPNAEYVSVCADFNGWSRDAHPMTRVTERGVWELFVPDSLARVGQRYKYCIRNRGQELLKSDPYAVSMEKPPETASVIAEIEGYPWRDASWLKYRKKRFTREKITEAPLNIYELHAGSWKRHDDGSVYSYRELAAELVTYVKQMGYTHIELMPLAEHPFDGSWGYQVSGYYAATARYGSPEDLMYLVDTMHEAGIGVIMDWVPAHFPKDAHGLYEFDGQPLYEYQGLDRREHATWGTRCFDVGREEVQSFLISNAVFWAEKYHVDGLRVDAVAAMLYLDFDRLPHEWIPNRYGDNKNLEAVAFFQKFNGVMAREFPDVMTIAEESTAWANLTHFENGGLGFTLKWNMGWMNDTLSYLEEDPLFRRHHHHKLTFSITYAYGEKYVLPISHDEVVHGKKSLLDRATGDYWQKFATTRAYLAYLMTHPGKKLLFMGCEYGPFREWNFADSLEWFMLDYEMHAKMQLYTARLNHLYLEHAALWELDGSPDGFVWIDADNEEQSIYSYRRRDRKGREVIVVLNFTPVRYDDFLLAVPRDGYYEELFNSDDEQFGGSGCTNEGRFRTEPALLRGYGQAIRVKVPPLGAAVFRMTRALPKKRER
ncbi:MAG: 1,4-alpha-glucan branching protein GlgB [Ruminococcaceae bacterium]|nr:1,4-alpha-glucan branching protein GlgB [Oscillospiraceae bacterium]